MSRNALPSGAWRLDPFTRILRYVQVDPNATEGDDPDTEEHGTTAGASRHYRNGEPACDECREAGAAYIREREARAAASGDPRYICACGAQKARRSARCAVCARAARWKNKEAA